MREECLGAAKHMGKAPQRQEGCPCGTDWGICNPRPQEGFTSPSCQPCSSPRFARREKLPQIACCHFWLRTQGPFSSKAQGGHGHHHKAFVLTHDELAGEPVHPLNRHTAPCPHPTPRCHLPELVQPFHSGTHTALGRSSPAAHTAAPSASVGLLGPPGDGERRRVLSNTCFPDKKMLNDVSVSPLFS